MFTIRKFFKFEMAHCLSSAYSDECCQYHGHSYKLEVIIESVSLNDDGMVIDFKLLKDIVNNRIVSLLDHKTVIEVNKQPPSFFISNEGIVEVGYNPTAENMAKDFYYKLKDILIQEIKGLVSLKIVLHETDTGYAAYTEKI